MFDRIIVWFRSYGGRKLGFQLYFWVGFGEPLASVFESESIELGHGRPASEPGRHVVLLSRERVPRRPSVRVGEANRTPRLLLPLPFSRPSLLSADERLQRLEQAWVSCVANVQRSRRHLAHSPCQRPPQSALARAHTRAGSSRRPHIRLVCSSSPVCSACVVMAKGHCTL